MSSMLDQANYQARLREALVALQKMRSKLETMERARSEPIAVIGIGCCFPGGANDPESFWQLLHQGLDAIKEVPADRWDIETYYDPDPDAPGKMSSRWGGFLTGVDQFDAHFFGISPREARSLDPQQRLVLEVSWEALEHAGLAPLNLAGSQTGVFIGITTNDYLQRQTGLNNPTAIDAYHITGSSLNSAAGRLAYTLGLQGPALAVDTACSSSLVAVHLACQSLHEGESALALAGGVNLILQPDMTISASKARMLAADGRCKTFDAQADGFVRSEGCGIVVLKRLSEALAAGDNILALIRGTAVNQDGFSSGLTVPNKLAQEAVIQKALAKAGIPPAQVSYIEAHGTGTALGDPIEVRALAAVLREGRTQNSPFFLGSVKTNIGHLESASGIAALIKVVLALQHQEIPPHLHFQTPTPNIDWGEMPIVVPTQAIPWPGEEQVAGVSSFGASGTNAHAIVSATPVRQIERDTNVPPVHLLALSAKDDNALKVLAARFDHYLERQPQTALADICFTANTGRVHFEHRLAVTGSSPEQIRERLAAFGEGETPAGLASGQSTSGPRPKLVFLFTGHGSQYLNMGRELYETEPIFRQTLEACAELLRPHLEQPLLPVMFPKSDVSPLWAGMKYTQPMLFALEYALARLWRSWGIEPDVVLGHSLGEYVAACVAGVMSLADGLKLVAARGRLMEALPQSGAMAAVFAGKDRVAAAIAPYTGQVAIAAINGPTNVVISGASEVIETILAELVSEGIRSSRLAVAQASHSPLIEPILADFEQTAYQAQFTAPQIPLVSNVTGQLFQPGEIPEASYWCRHLREPVMFATAMEMLHLKGYRLFVEMGPGPTLLGMGRRCLPEDAAALWLPSLRKGRSDWQQMLESLGTLYVQGVNINWPGLYKHYTPRRLALPTYPFQRQRYWLKTDVQPSLASSSVSLHPLLGCRLRSAGKEIIFETSFSLDSHPFLADHRVYGTVILPATVYLEMAQVAAQIALEVDTVSLEAVIIHKPLIVPDEGRAQIVQLILIPEADRTASFQIASLEADKSANTTERWRLHVTGTVRPASAPEHRSISTSLAELQASCQENLSADVHYQQLSSLGLEFGPGFQGVTQLWRHNQEVIGQISMPEVLAAEAPAYQIHPALLDACLQLLGSAFPEGRNGHETYLPMSLDQFTLVSRPGNRLWSHLSIQSNNGSQPEIVSGDLQLFDERGQPVARIKGFTLKRTGPGAVLAAGLDHFDNWLYEVVWHPRAIEPTRLAAPALLSPLQVADHLQRRLTELSTEPKAVTFHQVKPQLETLSTAYILTAFQQLGWTFKVGQRISATALAQQLNIIEPHRRLLNRLLTILQEEGLLKQIENEWEVLQIPATFEPENQLARLLDQYPACHAELTLTARLGRQLDNALRGDCDSLDLLFSNGSFEEVAHLYQDSPLAYGFNTLVKEAIVTALAHLPPDCSLRILEIGAGTGGTTAHVLPSLKPEQIDYLFTDVSPLFINQAKRKFQDYPHVQYQILDITHDLEAQGFAAHQFDLILAANVLHATPDLRQTLRNVQTLLTSEGLLVLLEATQPQRFADVIVGLTEGWWTFEDTDLRPAYPLISTEQWLKLLPELGFQDVAAVTGETTLSHQAILLGRGPHLEQDQRPGDWLIFADEGGLGQQLAERLQAQGQHPILIYPGEAFEAVNPTHFRINPAQPEAFQRLVRQLLSGNSPSGPGIIHLWALDQPVSYVNKLTAAGLAEAELKICGSVLSLVQALAATGEMALPGLWLITRGAQPAGYPDEMALPGLAQSTLWGLGKVIAQEHPEMNCIRVDLDPGGASTEIDTLLRLIERRDQEDQIALRRNELLIPRLVPTKPLDRAEANQHPALNGQPFKLDISKRGVLDNLEFRPLSRRSPGPGEVEIEVQVTGLGFRDVLKALGMVDQDTGPLGGECAGRIVAVGANVKNFEIGDEVMAMALGSFRSHITIPADFVAHKPGCLSMVEAATIPSAFLTAYYTLHHLANISPGDRVLIHAAAGGVGLAAVQLAQRAGAEIFATAGSAAKRTLLRSLGVRRVMDSRSLSFAEEIMTLTQGKGVDIVLNSLADDFIPKSLSVLADDGIFLEIGKRDIWDRAQIAQQKPKAIYLVADLVTLANQEPGLIAMMLRELIAAFNEGTLTPLPLRVFSIQNVVDAFRYMAQARHTGKIVVTLPSQKRQLASPAIHASATYLITGGLGGLGLVMARWLIAQGARHLVLVGRSAPSEEVRKTLAKLEQTGARIMVAQADVSQAEEMGQVITQIEQSLPPLRGVIHAAGVLDDGVLLQQRWDRFIKVFKPKVEGGWNLHKLTRTLPLDFFVLFSSAVSLLGSAGQPNHVAASAFLDALAHYRRTQGLQALSIDWGPWTEVGAAAQGNIEARLSMRGVEPISPQQGVQVFAHIMDQALAQPEGSPLAQMGVASIQWPKFLQQLNSPKSPFFSEVAQERFAYPERSRAAPKTVDEAYDLLERLTQAPPAKRHNLLQAYVQSQSLKVLGLEPTYPLDQRKPLQELGLDSLMAVELRNRLGTGLKLKLPATLVFSHPSVEALSNYLSEQLFPSEPAQSDAHQKSEARPPVGREQLSLTDLEQLSDEEVEALLLLQLKKGQPQD